MKNLLKEKRGFILITTILALALMSILGIAIMGVASSNFKMGKIDSRSQSAYYIAESGVNYIIDKINTEVNKDNSEFNTIQAFFRNIDNLFTKNTIVLENFEENSGEQPKAFITVSHVGREEDTRDYKIESLGKIGDSARTVNSVISIDWSKQDDFGASDLLLNTNKFIFSGSNFNAPGKTIVISGQDNNSMNGGSEIRVKNIYFKQLENGVISGKSYGDINDPGDIYLDGNARILSSGRTMYGDVHTNGDFIVTGGVTIHGNLYVGGKFEANGGTNIYGNLYVKEDFKFHGCTVHGNVFVNEDVEAKGGGKINGNLSTEGNMIISGDSVIEGKVDILGNIDATGGAKINGKLNVGGNAKFVSVILNSDVNVDGNMELGWTPTFNKEIYYTGNLKAPSNFNQDILEKCLSVKSVPEIPKMQDQDYSFEIPNCRASLKSDSWYEGKGYEIKKGYISSEIPQNAKWVVDNYKNTSYQKIDGEIIIISKGDIILRGESSFKGALIAPNGVVKYTGGDFEGVVISNKEISLSGWGLANMQTLEQYFGHLNIPVILECANDNDWGNNNGSEGIVDIQVIIKSGIKEK